MEKLRKSMGNLKKSFRKLEELHKNTWANPEKMKRKS